MIAADTNVILRLILNDDERQVTAVRAIMARQSLFVPLTVMLETGWVLASRYQMPRDVIADSLDMLLLLDKLNVARSDAVKWAIDRFRAGADWADVVHVVAASKVGGFVTFDRRLVSVAGDEAPVPITRIP